MSVLNMAHADLAAYGINKMIEAEMRAYGWVASGYIAGRWLVILLDDKAPRLFGLTEPSKPVIAKTKRPWWMPRMFWRARAWREIQSQVPDFLRFKARNCFDKLLPAAPPTKD